MHGFSFLVFNYNFSPIALEGKLAHAVQLTSLDLSRFCAAPSARLSHLSFESDRAFPAQC